VPPRRVVSLVPSETATMFALGLGDRLVGRTRYCTEPAGEVDDIPICGGIKDIDVDAVLELEPDLILCNQEENPRDPIADLVQRGCTVLVAFPCRVADALAHVARLARLFEVADRAEVVDLVRRGYNEIRLAAPTPARAIFVPIWMEPMMTVGGNTYADDILALAGARNIYTDVRRKYPAIAERSGLRPMPSDGIDDSKVRYPEVDLDKVVARAPEIVLLPDEPYEFTDADVAGFASADMPAARRDAILPCDGKDLFWYGSHSVAALPRLRAMIAALG
jgi:ABC-type Fe3+-hydroxamate transport system substrate-binding protein